MPELPEVEILVRQLSRRLRRSTIRRIELCDPKIRLSRGLAGKQITRIARRGKYIAFELAGESHMLAHLRMTGWFEFARPANYRLAIHTDQGSVYLEDRRRLAGVRAVSSAEIRAIFDRLGPEPLARDFDLTRLNKTSRPVKVALLDQSRVAGLGNIYASESLWRARLNPKRRANRLRPDELGRLRRAIVGTLRRAVRLGEQLFTAPNQFAVYERAGQRCRRCGGRIQRIVQAGRSTYYCASCQW
jgi:formamidopyrimidine-DNA glycosylase